MVIKMPQKIAQRIFLARPEFWICLLLAAATFAVYGQVRQFDFVSFDDPEYLTQNPYVQKGLNRQNIVWAFKSVHAANWHPLTWLSHMLDVQLYGMNPGPHHLTNLLIHVANSLMVFFVFRLTTGALWRSALAAALFALHPLHVESVAWIAERKDVLSTFFWLLTLLLYTRYTRRPALPGYLAVLLCYALGLMSKPMLVTGPFILLLLDYWPLNRFRKGRVWENREGRAASAFYMLIYEKVPFFILSAASCAVTIYAQRNWGALSSVEALPFGTRVANAVAAYAAYIGKMIWPARLAAMYPHSQELTVWQTGAGGLIILSISLAVFRFGRRQPCLVIGWLWYLITLIPVIGLVQVGLQSMADRYTYVPLIGLFIMIVWGVPDRLLTRRFAGAGLAAAAAAVLIVLSVTAWKQVRHWENSSALFRHAVRATDGNYFAYNSLGVAMENRGMSAAAVGYFNASLRTNPDFTPAYVNLGSLLAKQGKSEQAIKYFEKVLQIDPEHIAAHTILGNIMLEMGKLDEAAVHFGETLRLNPRSAQACNNLGIVLAKKEKTAEAIAHFQKALQLDPEYAEAYYNLGNVLADRGRSEEALRCYSKAVQLDSGRIEALINLGNMLAKTGRLEAAVRQYRRALRLQPDNAQAIGNLREAEAAEAKTARAIAKLRQALARNPDDVVAYYELGRIYTDRGEAEKAAAQFKRALALEPAFFDSSKNLAIIYAMQGRYDSARSVLKEAIAAGPDNWEAYYYIAATYARQNRIDESVMWLKKAVREGFHDWDLLRNDSNLAGIRQSAYYRELMGNRK